uniref:Rhamnosyl O-methyltransferase n=1 Tax=Chlamydomonas euryale TaxID=1486919 RepID=A0A7R9VRG8_9CHLO|mmetsp:Transcript_42575/g.127672  ORF Transcript_42575/g.127672 Transcript_42575/m.127672 type:complete len:535 (+) Transcript_42575:139-1743(+)
MRKAVAVLVGLAGVAMVGLLVLAPNFVQENTVSLSSLSSSFVAGGGGSRSREQSLRVAQLEREVERLKEVLAREQAAESDPEQAKGLPMIVPESMEDRSNFSVNIDLLQFLGHQQFFSGISWDPVMCMPSWKTVFEGKPEEFFAAAKARLASQLQLELAKIKGVDPKEVELDKPYHELFGRDDENVLAADPDMERWQSKIMVVLSRWMVHHGEVVKPTAQSFLFNMCSKVKGKEFTPEQFGTAATDCTTEMTEEDLLNQLGSYTTPMAPLNEIAHVLIEYGTCGFMPRGQKTFAKWLRTERMFNPDWMTFAVATPEQDAVVLLLDVLYEKLGVFKRQYWQGVITMQNPFDMYAIQDILFTVRPTLMVETGTANGGSALLWASVLHLSEVHDAKIVTIDLVEPAWEEGESWGGRVRNDATKHKLWDKHVHFLKGSTVEQAVVDQVKGMAAGQKVMVLLDSHHTATHVLEEMNLYCPMVSVGSYCIVEDTKMSRWSSTGPLEAVKEFLAHHPEFQMDREREFLYSHHAMGYLKRVQ